jgi:hypothetical protein
MKKTSLGYELLIVSKSLAASWIYHLAVRFFRGIAIMLPLDMLNVTTLTQISLEVL